MSVTVPDRGITGMIAAKSILSYADPGIGGFQRNEVTRPEVNVNACYNVTMINVSRASRLRSFVDHESYWLVDVHQDEEGTADVSRCLSEKKMSARSSSNCDNQGSRAPIMNTKQ
jgi:hypothetical protein